MEISNKIKGNTSKYLQSNNTQATKYSQNGNIVTSNSNGFVGNMISKSYNPKITLVNTEVEYVELNVFVDPAEVDKKINELIEVMNTGQKSDEIVLNALCNAFRIELLKGNKEAEKMLETLIKVKKENPSFAYLLSDDSSYYRPFTQNVVIERSLLNSSSALFHETGHALYDLVTGEEIPKNIDYLIKAAYYNLFDGNLTIVENNLATKNKYVEQVNAELSVEISGENRQISESEYVANNKGKYEKLLNNEMVIYSRKIFGKSEIASSIISTISENDMIYSLLLDYGIEPETIHYVLATDMSPEELAGAEYRSYNNRRFKEIKYIYGEGAGAVEDIIDAIWSGKYQGTERIGVTSDGESFAFYPSGHGEKYYNRDVKPINTNDYYCEYNEMVANFTDLKISNNQEALNDLKLVVGEELYNELESTYNKFLNYN